MSDSSSEDELAPGLLESVDKTFLSDSLFTENKTREIESKLPPSLRPKEENPFTNTGLSQSNQSYIAERFSERLDKELEKLEKNLKTRNSDANIKSPEGGVLLFSNSVKYLSDCDSECTIVNKRKTSGIKLSKEKLKARCKAVAVSPDWILSGAATKGWSKNTKGKVVHVKKLKTEHNSNVTECELIE